MNLGPERQTMTVKSPCNFEETVIFMMDYSHVMKKVRNNIIKSGLKKKLPKIKYVGHKPVFDLKQNVQMGI
jgi:hypothetical protein